MSKVEEYIKANTKKCSNLMQVPTLDDKGNIVPEAHPWLTPDDARKAVEIARKETLLEVAAWINDTFIFSKQAKEDFSQTFNIKRL